MNIIYKKAKVWYLEIRNPQKQEVSKVDLKIEKQFPVALKYYKEVYKKVGEPWDWSNRLVMDEKKLRILLDDSKNEIYYAYFEGKLAGYFELDTHHDDMELVYFGLTPPFIGKGLGKAMMQQILEIVNRREATRLWLHTCEIDSPQALKFYQKSGFKIYDEKIENQTIIEY